MSLKLVQTWVNAAFRGPLIAQHAMKLFDKAADDGVDATLIAAPELMNNGKCCLAHWTRHELVVLELTSRQQRAFGIKKGEMIHELALVQEPRELPPISRVNLLDVRIDHRLQHNACKPLTGAFTFETIDRVSGPAFRYALRVKYFHPRTKCRITGYSHGHLAPPRGELPFSFDPLASVGKHEPAKGPFVLFFQLVSAQNWTTMTKCQRISNVAARMIEVV